MSLYFQVTPYTILYSAGLRGGRRRPTWFGNFFESLLCISPLRRGQVVYSIVQPLESVSGIIHRGLSRRTLPETIIYWRLEGRLTWEAIRTGAVRQVGYDANRNNPTQLHTNCTD